jgi:hypothetical protein
MVAAMTRTHVVASVAAGALVLAAAGSAAPRTGVYRTTITGATPAVLNATWRLSFTGFAFALDRNRAPAVQGITSGKGNRVVFRDLAGPFRCRGAQAVGTYTWRLTRSILRFTRVADACVGRRTVLARPFRKIG